mgnify:CR=1 FL=1
MYCNLLEAGWTLAAIDAMDFIGYVRLVAWKARKKQEPRETTIDELWPWMNSMAYQVR